MQAVEAIYVSIVNVCIRMFSEVMIFEQVVRLWIVLSSHSCIVVLRQANIMVVVTA